MMSTHAADPVIPSPYPPDDTVPGERQTWWFWIAFVLTWLATGIAQGVAGVAVPQLLKEWNPDQATGDLSIVLTAGGTAILVTTPIFGRLSDRSRSRLGLRRPWIAAGVLIAAIGYLLQAFAPSLLLLGAGAVLVLVGWGAVSMTIHTLFADQIRRRIRAIMSAVTGAATTVGIFGGVALAGAVSGTGQVGMFLIPGGIAVVLAISLFFALRDLHRTVPAPPLDWRGLIETFWAAYFTSEYKDVAAFSILIVVLIFLPTGLLGRPEVEKV